MKLNADLSKSVSVNSQHLPWIDSPLPGVQRRMLERDGAEAARRATTIVRYAANSYFDFHSHDAGEEFIVLEGVFSDEMGDFPAGMYVRNPPGSKHRPHTREGCTIFVKLRQFDPQDMEFVRVDTRDEKKWLATHTAGIDELALHQFSSEQVRLERWQANTQMSQQDYPQGKEIYVLSGTLSDQNGDYPEGNWLRLPAGGSQTAASSSGCLLYVKTGHL